MLRTLGALLGLAVIGALFAAIYYGDTRVVEDRPPAFNLAPGEVRPTFLHPSVPGGVITVHIRLEGGPIDLWVMDQEWLTATIAPGGGFDLSQPFSYYSEWSRMGVTGELELTFVADGRTRLALVFDHTDTYYTDTAPGPDAEPASIWVHSRYLAQETRSLVLGYIAAVPSVLLVALTLGHQVRRWRRDRRERMQR